MEHRVCTARGGNHLYRRFNLALLDLFEIFSVRCLLATGVGSRSNGKRHRRISPFSSSVMVSLAVFSRRVGKWVGVCRRFDMGEGMLCRREITEEYWMTPSGLAADTMVVLAQGVRLSWGVTGGGIFSCSDMSGKWYSDRQTHLQTNRVIILYTCRRCSTETHHFWQPFILLCLNKL